MKKILSLTLVLTILISCVGCGKNEPVNTDTPSTTESTTVESTTETTTESTTEETTTETTTQTTTIEKQTESTTKKKVENITKKETTTKKKPVTTTKKHTTTTASNEPDFEYEYKKVKDGITYYYVIDETGYGYYTDKNGIRKYDEDWVNGEIATGDGDLSSTDLTRCRWCGSKNCCPSTKDYFCDICNKYIYAYECHPQTCWEAEYGKMPPSDANA